MKSVEKYLYRSPEDRELQERARTLLETNHPEIATIFRGLWNQTPPNGLEMRSALIYSKLTEKYREDPSVPQAYLNWFNHLIDTAPRDSMGWIHPEGVSERLLDHENATKIGEAMGNPVFLHFAYNGNIPSYALTERSGRPMLHQLTSDDRWESRMEEGNIAEATGIKDANGELAHYLGKNPTAYLIYGPGDCETEIRRLRPVVESGREVTVVLIDCSQDMLNESSKNLKKTFGNRSNLIIIPIHSRFEQLPNNQEFKNLIMQYPRGVAICYGNTFTNNPPEYTSKLFGRVIPPGYIAEFGIEPFDGDFERVRNLFVNDETRVTREEALLALNFSKRDINSMDYGVGFSEIKFLENKFVKRRRAQDELAFSDEIPKLQAFFQASKKVQAGLVILEEKEKLVVSQRYLYRNPEFRRVVSSCGFEYVSCLLGKRVSRHQVRKHDKLKY